MPTISADSTLASRHAANNLAANCEALAAIQPSLAISASQEECEWVFGRDRSLTARDSTGRWLTGCSLPTRAAAEMLASLDTTGPVACFLVPSHAAQLRTALDKLPPNQAIIAIIPDAAQLPILLACEHFGKAIAGNRLWFAVGEDWPRELKKLFDDHAGLCTPTQFIRLPISDNGQIESLIGPAQKVFAEVTAERAASIRSLRDSHSPRVGRVCIAASSHFRLWDDAGHTLRQITADSDYAFVDLDDPVQAGSLWFAKQAADCDAIIAANIGRADLPNMLSDSLRWIAWASGHRIPNFNGAAPRDLLIVADAQCALKQGWPIDRIIEASWPETANHFDSDSLSAESAALSLIADTNPLDVPDDLIEYSSHAVLWEMIAVDLRNNPFVLNADIEGFLDCRMRKLDIAGETLARGRFIAQLILPAYQQGLARLLLHDAIPVRLFGRGWDRIPEFAPHACGAINDREQFQVVVGQSAGLIHVWPNLGPHAIDALSRPVLRRRSNLPVTFINDARKLLAGRLGARASQAPGLSIEVIQKSLAQ